MSRERFKDIGIKLLIPVQIILGLGIWWECPWIAVLVAVMAFLMIAVLFENKPFYYICIAGCLLIIGLSVWNWDLQVGTQILQYIRGY